MTCPRCGSSTEPNSASCPVCQAQVAAATPAAAAHDEGDTSLGLAAAFDDGATMMPVPAGRPVDPDATNLGLAAAFDSNATILPAAGPRADDETSLGAAPPAPPQKATSRARPTPRVATAPRPPVTFGQAATDLVGHQLGPRYHIIKLLGAGGMGAVYQAWDAELGVAVALKTVRPEVAADPDTALMLERRFKQELLLARKVTHKNIVRVHDIGEVEGVKYITMPYVEGEDLATILKRDGKLSVPRVMKLARSVVSGLLAAHEAGVVHRDLKPANIMVNADGEGLVMDFGVARSTEGTEAPSGASPAGLPAAFASVSAANTMAQTMAGSVVASSSAGSFWISSMMTTVSAGVSDCRNVSGRALSSRNVLASSRSTKRAFGNCCRSSVLLPVWRGPSRKTDLRLTRSARARVRAYIRHPCCRISTNSATILRIVCGSDVYNVFRNALRAALSSGDNVRPKRCPGTARVATPPPLKPVGI